MEIHPEIWVTAFFLKQSDTSLLKWLSAEIIVNKHSLSQRTFIRSLNKCALYRICSRSFKIWVHDFGVAIFDAGHLTIFKTSVAKCHFYSILEHRQ